MNWLVAIVMGVALAAGIAASLGHGGPALSHQGPPISTQGVPWGQS